MTSLTLPKSESVSNENKGMVGIEKESIPQNIFGEGVNINTSGIEPSPNVSSNPIQTRTQTKEINIEDIQKANVADTVKVDFLSDTSSASSFIQGTTEPPKEKPTSNNSSGGLFGGGSSTGTDAPFINDPAGGSGIGSMGKPTTSRADFKSTVNVIVSGADILISQGLCMLAGDNSSAAYSATEQQRTLLKEAITELMFEKQAKIPSWVLVIMGVLGAYGAQTGKAFLKRRDKTGTKTMLAQSSGSVKPIAQPIYQPPLQKTPTFPTQSAPIPNPQNLGVVSKPENKTVVDNSLKSDKDGNVHFPNPEFNWRNPNPEVIANDRNDLYDYLGKGIFPMYIRNKTNPSIIKAVPYDPLTGEVKLGGRPAKIGK